jgi:hypothetical protein
MPAYHEIIFASFAPSLRALRLMLLFFNSTIPQFINSTIFNAHPTGSFNDVHPFSFHTVVNSLTHLLHFSSLLNTLLPVSFKQKSRPKNLR